MSKFTTIFHKVARRIISFAISFFIIHDSRTDFAANLHEGQEEYKRRIPMYKYETFVQPEWKHNTEVIEKFFLGVFSNNFLRYHLLKGTMFAHLPKLARLLQKKLIVTVYGSSTAKQVLRENSTGNPILNDLEFLSSGNSIHHLYHLAKFKKETGTDISNCNLVVELGGGYGNFAKIVKKLNTNVTYVMFDIPIFSFIQLTYLQTVFGREAVHLYEENRGIVPNKINIIPFNETTIRGLKHTLGATPDVFVSTWALSESNQATQNLMRSLSFFDAKYLLIAYQKANELFSFAQDVIDTAGAYRTLYNEETEYLKDNYYFFAQKNSVPGERL